MVFLRFTELRHSLRSVHLDVIQQSQQTKLARSSDNQLSASVDVAIFLRCFDSKVLGANMGPSGADRAQMGPILAPWTLLSGVTHM